MKILMLKFMLPLKTLISRSKMLQFTLCIRPLFREENYPDVMEPRDVAKYKYSMLL